MTRSFAALAVLMLATRSLAAEAPAKSKEPGPALPLAEFKAELSRQVRQLSDAEQAWIRLDAKAARDGFEALHGKPAYQKCIAITASALEKTETPDCDAIAGDYGEVLFSSLEPPKERVAAFQKVGDGAVAWVKSLENRDQQVQATLAVRATLAALEDVYPDEVSTRTIAWIEKAAEKCDSDAKPLACLYSQMDAIGADGGAAFDAGVMAPIRREIEEATGKVLDTVANMQERPATVQEKKAASKVSYASMSGSGTDGSKGFKARISSWTKRATASLRAAWSKWTHPKAK